MARWSTRSAPVSGMDKGWATVLGSAKLILVKRG
jgi:hypothetical protein